MKDKKEIIKQFIQNNKLQFTEGRRNADCVILAGFALYINVNNSVCLDVLEDLEVLTDELEDMFYQVLEYADRHNYGEYWVTQEAKETYIF